MKRIFDWLIVVGCLLFLIGGCKHRPQDESQDPATGVPSGLMYSPDAVQIQTGQNFASTVPAVVGAKQMRFTLLSEPDAFGSITIDELGVIHADSLLAAGVYKLTVVVSNPKGPTTFKDAFYITVNQGVSVPSSLDYQTDTLKTSQGSNTVSNTPTIKGTHPVTFSLNTSPNAGKAISIDTSTGQIRVDSTLGIGNYVVHVKATNSVGTKNFDTALVISVKPVLPSQLHYEPNFTSLSAGDVGKSEVPTILGTKPVVYHVSSVNPSSTLIRIDSLSGQLTSEAGLPVGIYSVSVAATNMAGGVSFANVYTFQVNANVQAPSQLSYSPSSLTLGQGQSGQSATPTAKGTGPLTYTISSAPTSGAHITIDASTGVITADASLPVGTYQLTVTASNSAGNTSATFTVTVNAMDVPSGLSYSPNTYTVLDGQSGSSVAPVCTSQGTVTYSIVSSPASSSISIDSKTGVITSSNSLAVGTYQITVKVTNSGGTATFQDAYTIIVSPVLPSALVYAPNTASIKQGTAHVSAIPTLIGSHPLTYSLTTSPSTSSISIDPNTGVISSATSLGIGNYIISVKVSNAAGDKTFQDVYTINVTNTTIAPSNLTYSVASLTLEVGGQGSSVVPTVSGTGPFSFTVVSTPANSSITVDAQSGVISVSHSVAVGTYHLTVTASNSAGSTTTSYTINVNPVQAPSQLVYTPNSYTVNFGTADSSAAPTVTSSTSVSFGFSTPPSNPAITINPRTGVVSSSSTLPVGTYFLTVAATNSGGSTTASFTIVVNAVPPSQLLYNPNSLSIAQGSAGSSVVPSVTGSQTITYSVAVAPTNIGISINSSTGVISVANTVLAGTYSITVTATNATGSTTADYTVVVTASAPSGLVYTPNSLTLSQGTASSSVAPTVSGTKPITFALSVSPSSTGITINSSTGVISSSSSVAAGTYSVNVTASNSAGSQLFTSVYTVKVNASGPSGLTYTPNSLTLTHGTAGNSATPTVTGAGPITYAMSASPSSSALTINSSTGVISATTTLPAGKYTITVTASNGSGSTTATYTVTINPSYKLDIAPIMSQYCTSCHKSGGNSPNLTTYSGVSTNIARVLSDITRGTMPPSGSKPSAAQVTLLQNWQSSGMAQ